MASRFVLTAQLQLQAPNVRAVVRTIRRELAGIEIDLKVKGLEKIKKDLKDSATAMKKMKKETKAAGDSFARFNSQLGKAIKNVIRYDIARSIVTGLSMAMRQGLRDAIKFERELIKVAQVTGKATVNLSGLTKEITNLSTRWGVASQALVKTARVLAQTGLAANDVTKAMKALALTTLAPTFDDIANTTETTIAIMRQFNITAGEVERELGRINAVAGQFAVEAADIGVAIRRAGGAFKAAGGQLMELEALFTSVRSTTRETAETIATGFRTIFTRMQRPKTIKFLRSMGIELQNLQGHFIGPYEAVKKLHYALKGLDPKDIRYSQIVEQLGGFRQVSKVIPLIQQFEVSQRALNVAMAGGTSLATDAQKAQSGLGVQLTKVKEEFADLIRTVSNSAGFKAMAKTVLSLASALIALAKAITPILPLLGMLAAGKGLSMGMGFLGGRMGGRKMARGGLVPGRGNGDTVPAMLEPGEFVLRKSAVNSIGVSRLSGVNRYSGGGRIKMKNGGKPEITQKPIKIGTEKKFGLLASTVNLRNKDPKDYVKVEALMSTSSNRYARKIVARDDHRGKSGAARVTGNVQVSAFAPDPPGAAEEFKSARKNLKKSWKKETADLATAVPEVSGLKSKKSWNKAQTGVGQLFEDFIVKFLKLDDPKNKAFDIPKKDVKATNEFIKAKFTGTQGRNDIKLRGDEQSASDVLRKGMNEGEYDQQLKRQLAKMEAEDNVAGEGKKKRRGRSRRAAGGSISGTDSVPALLTPGEFVVNRKSAEAFGYGRLGKLNKYAKGGIVGRQRFAEGGAMAGGGGTAIAMMMGGEMFIQMLGTMGILDEKALEVVNKFTQMVMMLGMLLMAIKSETVARNLSAISGTGFGKMLTGLTGKVGFLGKASGRLGKVFTSQAKIGKTAMIKSMRASKAAGAFTTRGGKAAARATAKAAAGNAMKVAKAAKIAAGAIAVLGIAANVAGDYIQDQGREQIKAGEYEKGKSNMQMGGALAGAGTGMAIGAIFGPFGIAIGGAVGALYGFVTATWEAENAINRAKFGKALEALSKSLEAVSKGEASPRAMAANIGVGMKALSDRFKTLSSEADATELQGAIKKTVPQFQAYLDKLAASVTSFEQLNNIVGTDTMRTFSQFSGIPISQLKKQYSEQIAEMKKSKAAQKKMLQVMQQQTKTALIVRDVTVAFTTLEQRLTQFDLSLSNLNQSMAGNFGAAMVGKMEPMFKDLESVLDVQEFRDRVDALGTMLGDLGKPMVKEVKSAQHIFSELPGILLEASNEIGIAGADAGNIIISKLEGADTGGVLTDTMKRQLEAQIEQFAYGAGGGEGKLAGEIKKDLDGVIKRLTKGIATSAKAFEAAAKFFDKANVRLAKAFETRTKIEMKIMDSRLKIEQTKSDNEAKLAKARGKEVSPSKESDLFQKSQDIRLQDTAIAGKGGNVNAVANEFLRLKEAVRISNAELAKQGITPQQLAGTKNLIDSQKVMIETNARLKKEFLATQKALKAFADTSKRVAELEKNIAKARKGREAKREVVSDFTFATDEGRDQLARELNTTFAAAAQGTIANVSEEMRPAVGKVLDRFKDIELPGFGGRTGGEVKKEMEIGYLESLFGPLTADMKKQIMEQTSAEERFIKDMETVQKAQQKAQQAMLIGLENDRKQANADIKTLHENLVNGLERVLIQQSLRAAKREIGQAKAKAKEDQQIQTGVQDIQAAGVGINQARSLDVLKKHLPAIQEAAKAQAREQKYTAAGLFSGKIQAELDSDDEDAFEGFIDTSQVDTSGTDYRAKALGEAYEQMEAFFRRNIKDREMADKAIHIARMKITKMIEKDGSVDRDNFGDAMEQAVMEMQALAKAEGSAAKAAIDSAKAAGYTDDEIKAMGANADKFAKILAKIPDGTTLKDLSDKAAESATAVNNLTTEIGNLQTKIAAIPPPVQQTGVAPGAVVTVPGSAKGLITEPNRLAKVKPDNGRDTGAQAGPIVATQRGEAIIPVEGTSKNPEIVDAMIKGEKIHRIQGKAKGGILGGMIKAGMGGAMAGPMMLSLPGMMLAAMQKSQKTDPVKKSVDKLPKAMTFAMKAAMLGPLVLIAGGIEGMRKDMKEGEDATREGVGAMIKGAMEQIVTGPLSAPGALGPAGMIPGAGMIPASLVDSIYPSVQEAPIEDYPERPPMKQVKLLDKAKEKKKEEDNLKDQPVLVAIKSLEEMFKEKTDKQSRFVMEHKNLTEEYLSRIASNTYASLQLQKEYTTTISAGAVRAASGGSIFAPSGTDTVPAMLTPGEFVVNRSAAGKNMGTLQAMNKGAVYMAGGGIVPTSLVTGGRTRNITSPDHLGKITEDMQKTLESAGKDSRGSLVSFLQSKKFRGSGAKVFPDIREDSKHGDRWYGDKFEGLAVDLPKYVGSDSRIWQWDVDKYLGGAYPEQGPSVSLPFERIKALGKMSASWLTDRTGVGVDGLFRGIQSPTYGMNKLFSPWSGSDAGEIVSEAVDAKKGKWFSELWGSFSSILFANASTLGAGLDHPDKAKEVLGKVQGWLDDLIRGVEGQLFDDMILNKLIKEGISGGALPFGGKKTVNMAPGMKKAFGEEIPKTSASKWSNFSGTGIGDPLSVFKWSNEDIAAGLSGPITRSLKGLREQLGDQRSAVLGDLRGVQSGLSMATGGPQKVLNQLITEAGLFDYIGGTLGESSETSKAIYKAKEEEGTRRVKADNERIAAEIAARPEGAVKIAQAGATDTETGETSGFLGVIKKRIAASSARMRGVDLNAGFGLDKNLSEATDGELTGVIFKTLFETVQDLNYLSSMGAISKAGQKKGKSKKRRMGLEFSAESLRILKSQQPEEYAKVVSILQKTMGGPHFGVDREKDFIRKYAKDFFKDYQSYRGSAGDLLQGLGAATADEIQAGGVGLKPPTAEEKADNQAKGKASRALRKFIQRGILPKGSTAADLQKFMSAEGPGGQRYGGEPGTMIGFNKDIKAGSLVDPRYRVLHDYPVWINDKKKAAEYLAKRQKQAVDKAKRDEAAKKHKTGGMARYEIEYLERNATPYKNLSAMEALESLQKFGRITTYPRIKDWGDGSFKVVADILPGVMTENPDDTLINQLGMTQQVIDTMKLQVQRSLAGKTAKKDKEGIQGMNERIAGQVKAAGGKQVSAAGKSAMLSGASEGEISSLLRYGHEYESKFSKGRPTAVANAQTGIPIELYNSIVKAGMTGGDFPEGTDEATIRHIRKIQHGEQLKYINKQNMAIKEQREATAKESRELTERAQAGPLGAVIEQQKKLDAVRSIRKGESDQEREDYELKMGDDEQRRRRAKEHKQRTRTNFFLKDGKVWKQIQQGPSILEDRVGKPTQVPMQYTLNDSLSFGPDVRGKTKETLSARWFESQKTGQLRPTAYDFFEAVIGQGGSDYGGRFPAGLIAPLHGVEEEIFKGLSKDPEAMKEAYKKWVDNYAINIKKFQEDNGFGWLRGAIFPMERIEGIEAAKAAGRGAGVRRDIENLDKELNAAERAKRVQYRAGGGLMYRSSGGGTGGINFAPMGSDVVPAMLTPGEFIVRKPAVDALGVQFLEYLNNMGAAKRPRGYNKGGDVQYLNNGGTSNATNGALNSAAFDQSVKDFSTAVKDLSKVSLGGTLSVDGTINVNVNLNGGEVISAAKDTLGKMAAQKVQAGINDMLKAHFPNIPRKSDMVFGEGYDPSWAQQP